MNKATTKSTVVIGDKPVVVLSLEDYERMQEDLEMLRSTKLPIKLDEARQQFDQGQVLTAAELKKTLGLS